MRTIHRVLGREKVKLASMGELRPGDRFTIAGDEYCDPDRILTATALPYRNKDGVWTVEVGGVSEVSAVQTPGVLLG